MHTVRVVCGSVGPRTNRIIKNTVRVEYSFGLVREAVIGTVETPRVNHADSILSLQMSSCTEQRRRICPVVLDAKHT